MNVSRQLILRSMVNPGEENMAIMSKDQLGQLESILQLHFYRQTSIVWLQFLCL